MRAKLWTALGVIIYYRHVIALMVAVITLIYLSGQVWGWADPDYQYRRPITCLGGASDLTDFQLNVSINATEYGNMTFYMGDDVTEIPFWVEDDTFTWFKSASNSTTFYVYYTKSGTPDLSNGSAVFITNADVGFDSTDGWTTVGTAANINTANSRAEFSGADGRIYADRGSADVSDFIYDFTVSISSVTAEGYGVGISDTEGQFNTWSNGIAAIFYVTGTGEKRAYLLTRLSGAQSVASYVVYDFTASTLYCTLSRAGSALSLECWTNSNRSGTPDISISATETQYTLRYIYSVVPYSSTSDAAGWIDSALVREYADPEPTCTVGAEETLSLILSLIEPADGAVSVSSYVNFTAYIEGVYELANLTLNVGSYTWVNETPLTNASNYTFTVYLPLGSYIWNMTLCDTAGLCITSENRVINVTGVDILIELRDEDTNDLIVNETAYIQIYNADTLELVNSTTTTTGKIQINLIAPINYIVQAYTNDSYINQRRLSFITSADVATQNVTISLLQNGRGISQPIRAYDRVTFQTVKGARVKIFLGGKLIDYSITDTQGRLYSYLDPYKMYSIEVSKDGYNSFNESLTPTTNEFPVYLLPVLQTPIRPKFSFNPSNAILNVNNTYIPMVSIEYYKELEAVTFTVAKSRAHYDYFKLTGQQQTGVVESETFNMSDLSWCNATYLCSYDATKITFRYSQSLLNDFGDYVLVIYNYTTIDGEKETAEKAYMFSNFKLNIAGMFTDTQKPWVGLGIILFGTFSVVGSMVRWGFNPTVRQIALIVYIFIVLDYVFGFFPASYLIMSTLILLGAVLGGRVL